MNAQSKVTKSKGDTVEDELHTRDREAAERMRIWNAVSRTDPRHTKKVNQRGGFTAISAHYQVMEATRMFGPVGIGWGYDNGDPILTDGIVVVPVTLWHGERANKYGPVFGGADLFDSRGKVDSDAPKKAATDGLTKGLSQLGFNADVFLGRFDDNKYVAALTEEFSKQAPETGDDANTDKGRADGDMAASALKGSLRMLVHHINGCSTSQELEDLLDTEDAKEVIENCERRFPAWYATGEGMPAEFVPLKTLIAQTRDGLAKLEKEPA